MTKQLRCSANQTPLFFFVVPCLLLIASFSQSIAQTVKGRVSAQRFSVQNALITFVDNADTSIQFSAKTDASGNYEIGLITSVTSDAGNVPGNFSLSQSYPNPFSGSAAIPYQLHEASEIQVTIYDVLGRQVRNFKAGAQAAGSHSILWDGRNDLGKRVANGIYFYRLQAGNESKVGKMVFNSGIKSLLSLPAVSSSRMVKQNGVVSRLVQAGDYTIRVQNADDTFPTIIPKQVSNVSVKNDTTINFGVSYVTSAVADFDSVHQFIRGFGAANILQWRPDMTESEIETAFGTGDGQLGFTILRLRLPPNSSEFEVNITTAKKAHEMGAIIFASPWNAPSEMLETVNGQRRVRHDMYAQYAAHLDSFNTLMTNEGVPIYAISVQNEPDYANDWTGWTSDEMLTFMRENAPAIRTRVMAPESFQFRRAMSDPLLNDSLACANLDIVGGHIYGAGLGRYRLAEEKGKEIWMTEHYTESQNSGNLWPLALDVATEIDGVMSSGWNAYVWWYIVRYYGPLVTERRVET